jgi:hypothetical protein
MEKERRFYIAYRICRFLNNREPSSRKFKDYEIAMYTAELAECIQIAEEKQDGEILKQYYDVLNEELQEHILYYGKEHEWTIKVETLIGLLDEWKN